MVGRASWILPSNFNAEAFHKESISFAQRAEAWIHEVHGHHLAPETADTYTQFSKALESLTPHAAEPPSEVLPLIQEQCETISGYRLHHPCQGFALGGVVSAIYFFLHSAGTYADILLEAIHSGGDTDSVGAIVGALAGALHGYASIPDRWKEDLVGREQIELRALALAGEPFEKELWRDLASMELEWTLAEETRRREILGAPPLTEEELADVEEIKIRPKERPRVAEDREGYGRPGEREERHARRPSRGGRRAPQGSRPPRGRPRGRRRDYDR
jgi:hypothetical protein